MKCKLLIVFAFVFISSFSFSQNTIKGTVQNKSGETLPYAHITVYNDSGTKFVTYTLSNELGNYTLKLPNGVYLFKVSFLGYKATEKKKNVSKNETLNFELLEDANELQEVVIETKSSDAFVRNDTTKYNLNRLTTGNEESLKDILKKLPGVEINESGKIVANGQKVDKLLIDGKEFFGDQQQLATENIGSEMVKGVSLIDNFSDFSDLENQKKSGKIAMNIEIGKNYKGKIKGNVTAGGGYKNKYEINTNLFSFRAKANLFFIGNANNIGNQTFTLQDYISFQGGIKKVISDNSGSNTFSLNNLPPYLSLNNEVKSKNEQFSALNFSYNPSKKLKLNSYIIFDRMGIKEEQFIKRTYLTNDRSIILDIDNNKNNTFLINSSFIDVIYKPSNNTVFEYVIDFSPQKNDLVENDNFTTKKYNTSRLIDNLSLNEALKFKSKFNRFLLSATAYHSIKNNKENLNLFSNNTFLSLLFPSSDFKVFQDIKNKNQVYGLNSFLATKIVKKSFVKLNYHISKKAEIFQTNIQNNPQHNNINLDVFENKLGLDFYNIGKPFLNYDIGCDVSFINSNKYTDIHFLPFANLNLNFNSSHRLTISYKRTIDLAQAKNIVDDDYIFSYNVLMNNQNIQPNTTAKYDNFRINYFIYDLFSGTLFTLGATYIKGKNFVATNTNYNLDYQINRYILGEINSKSNAHLIFNKKFDNIPFIINLKSLFSYIDNYNYINGKPGKYTYSILNNELSVSSNFSKSIFNFELGYKNKQSTVVSKSMNTKSKVYLHQPHLNVFLNYKNFNLNINSSIEFYETNLLEKRIYTISPSLYYKTNNKKWKFYIKAQDILNLNKNYIIENIAYNNYFQEKTVSTIGGFVIMGLAYKF